MADIQQGDIGTILRATLEDSGTVVDVSTATVKQIKLQKPDGTDVTKTAVFTTDGSDGKIQYVTVADDLDQSGEWKIQGYVEMPNWQGHSAKDTFFVGQNLS